MCVCQGEHWHILCLSSQHSWEPGRAGAIVHISEKGTGEVRSCIERRSVAKQGPGRGLLTLSQGVIPSRPRSILISTGESMKLWRQGSDVNFYPLDCAWISQYSQVTP